MSSKNDSQDQDTKKAKTQTQTNGQPYDEALDQNYRIKAKQLDDANLHKALRDVFDLFEALAGLRCLLLGETAKSVKEGHLTGDKITVGLREKELTPERRSTIVTYLRKYQDRGISKTMVFEPEEHIISYDFVGVPIEIKIITRDYNFFEHLDPISYQFDEYVLPNPLQKYLKAQYIVQ